jgi:hypothetical protein
MACMISDVVLETRISAGDCSRRFSKVSAGLGLESRKSRLGSAHLREASLETLTTNFELLDV